MGGSIPWLSSSPKGDQFGFCKTCQKHLSCCEACMKDLKRHGESETHLKLIKSCVGQQTFTSTWSASQSISWTSKVARAEKGDSGIRIDSERTSCQAIVNIWESFDRSIINNILLLCLVCYINYCSFLAKSNVRYNVNVTILCVPSSPSWGQSFFWIFFGTNLATLQLWTSALSAVDHL